MKNISEVKEQLKNFGDYEKEITELFIACGVLKDDRATEREKILKKAKDIMGEYCSVYCKFSSPEGGYNWAIDFTLPNCNIEWSIAVFKAVIMLAEKHDGYPYHHHEEHIIKVNFY